MLAKHEEVEGKTQDAPMFGRPGHQEQLAESLACLANGAAEEALATVAASWRAAGLGRLDIDREEVEVGEARELLEIQALRT